MDAAGKAKQPIRIGHTSMGERIIGIESQGPLEACEAPPELAPVPVEPPFEVELVGLEILGGSLDQCLVRLADESDLQLLRYRGSNLSWMAKTSSISRS